MEDILYKNSVSDIRIREMVTKADNNDFSLSSLKKITLRSFRGDEEDTIVLPLSNLNYSCDFKIGFIYLLFNDINFLLGNGGCPLVIKLDNIYKSYEIEALDNNDLNLLYIETKDQNSEPNETLIVSITDDSELSGNNGHLGPEIIPTNPNPDTHA